MKSSAAGSVCETLIVWRRSSHGDRVEGYTPRRGDAGARRECALATYYMLPSSLPALALTRSLEIRSSQLVYPCTPRRQFPRLDPTSALGLGMRWDWPLATTTRPVATAPILLPSHSRDCTTSGAIQPRESDDTSRPPASICLLSAALVTVTQLLCINKLPLHFPDPLASSE